MGDTARGSWGSRELGRHIEQEKREEQRKKDWLLASVAAEFGYKAHEKGWNIQKTIEELAIVFESTRRERKS